ncbi:hypothetical protein ACTI_06490 [Actinoplanes sp. OR16]|uniref:hypothetical protein n=1 Tax=Actinoplanes sp. OR16 TaxID=946334 RepID=UPI000F6FC688|nr:hypothetical protein [Actinoplanes sp. OR16]BBH63964.1 hypothetical protein ACTI_06490 [Actinoplanes sp. OR16]
MSDLAQPRIWSNIDIPKTIAGTLAAVSAAVVGSFLGVAGTVIGAAVASLISSIGTEVYHRYLDHGTKKLQSAFVTTPMAAQAAVGTPEVAAAEEPPSGNAPRTIRWKRVAMVAGALFVLGLATLTAAELLTGKSAADATRGGDGGSPTLFQLSGNGGDSPEKSGNTEEKEPAPATTSTDGATQEPAEDATETTPNPDATTDPGTGSGDTGTQDPATQDPATQDPGAGTGADSGSDSGSGSGKSDTGSIDSGAGTTGAQEGTE